MDMGSPLGDRTAMAFYTPKVTTLAVIPRGLGAVTSMRIFKGRVICQTESGIDFVVGIPTGGNNEDGNKSKI